MTDSVACTILVKTFMFFSAFHFIFRTLHDYILLYMHWVEKQAKESITQVKKKRAGREILK